MLGLQAGKQAAWIVASSLLKRCTHDSTASGCFGMKEGRLQLVVVLEAAVVSVQLVKHETLWL